jgi:2-polyprenyl-6-methoxyphenol hydroxylase-like FAD-dependent oxidoreductase
VPRLTGMVAQGNQPAAWAYVQLTNLAGDFQAEIRANAEGAFTLYPVAGRWRLITWALAKGHAEREIQVGSEDLQVQLELR